jgi:hypothetical protein
VYRASRPFLLPCDEGMLHVYIVLVSNSDWWGGRFERGDFECFPPKLWTRVVAVVVFVTGSDENVLLPSLDRCSISGRAFVAGKFVGKPKPSLHEKSAHGFGGFGSSTVDVDCQVLVSS